MFKTLISAEQLKPLSTAIIFDCRFELTHPQAGVHAYSAAHIPGAHYAHLDEHLSDIKTGTNGRHPLPEAAALIAFLRRCGVNNDSQMVAYDNHGGIFAARLWWLARWLGHEAVAVLDGGLAAWQAHGGITASASAATPAATPPRVTVAGNFSQRPTLQAAVTVENVLKNLTTQADLVIDARPADRFRGENETIDPVAGHIPNAVNRFAKSNLQDNGCFKSAEQLREEWVAVLGAQTPAASIAQCGSGAAACHNLLAMEIAGLSGGKLYAGSWSEWCADPARPVERG